MKCNSSAHILLCHRLFDVIRTNSNLTENRDISSKLKDIFQLLAHVWLLPIIPLSLPSMPASFPPLSHVNPLRGGLLD